MAIPWAAIAAVVASLVPLLAGQKKTPSVAGINRRYINQRPEGYLSDEDTAFGERALARTTATIGTGAETQRAFTRRRLGARGITGAASEQATKDITGEEIHAREDAGMGVQDLLHRIRTGNQQFEREKMFKAWGAEIGDGGRQQGRQDLQQSTYWNSMLEFLPKLLELKGQVATQTPDQPDWWEKKP